MVVAGSLRTAVRGLHDTTLVVPEGRVASRDGDGHRSLVELSDGVTDVRCDVSSRRSLSDNTSRVVNAGFVSGTVGTVGRGGADTLIDNEVEVLVDPATIAAVVSVVCFEVSGIDVGTVKEVLLRDSDWLVTGLDRDEPLRDSGSGEGDTRTA